MTIDYSSKPKLTVPPYLVSATIHIQLSNRFQILGQIATPKTCLRSVRLVQDTLDFLSSKTFRLPSPHLRTFYKFFMCYLPDKSCHIKLTILSWLYHSFLKVCRMDMFISPAKLLKKIKNKFYLEI